MSASPVRTRRRLILQAGALALCAGVALGLLGCGALNQAGRNLGVGLVAGSSRRAMDESTKVALDSLLHRTGRSAARAIAKDLYPAIDSSLIAALGHARGSLLLTTDSLAWQLRGPLRASLREAIRSAIAGAGDQLRGETEPTMASLSDAAAARLQPMLARALGAAADTLTTHLALGMRTKMTEAADTLVSRTVGAATRKTSGSDLWVEIRRSVTIGAILLVVLFAIWLWRDRQQGQETLAAVARVVNLPGNEAIKPQIRAEARSRRVEGWLNTFLEKKELL